MLMDDSDRGDYSSEIFYAVQMTRKNLKKMFHWKTKTLLRFTGGIQTTDHTAFRFLDEPVADRVLVTKNGTSQ